MKITIGVLLIIGIIIVLVFTMSNKPASFSIFYDDSKSECEIQRQYLFDDGRVCVMPCIQMTSTIHNCISQYGYTGYSDNIGEWLTITSSVNHNSETCREYYEADIQAKDPRDYGMYMCIPEFKSQVGEIDVTGECTLNQEKCVGFTWFTCTPDNTWGEQGIVRTKCGVECLVGGDCSSGQCTTYKCQAGTCNTGADTDCNHIVSRTELGSYITKWTSGQISRTNLAEAIQAWVSG